MNSNKLNLCGAFLKLKVVRQPTDSMEKRWVLRRDWKIERDSEYLLSRGKTGRFPGKGSVLEAAEVGHGDWREGRLR